MNDLVQQLKSECLAKMRRGMDDHLAIEAAIRAALSAHSPAGEAVALVDARLHDALKIITSNTDTKDGERLFMVGNIVRSMIACPNPARLQEGMAGALSKCISALELAHHKSGVVQGLPGIKEAILAGKLALAHPAPPASPAESGWQPIETAPKDGTRIAIKFSSGNRKEATWRTTYGGEWHVDSCTHLPWADQHEITHWQLLPAAPTEGAK